ncbi:unconventional myosin-XV [Toxorhynchites rutilus septentrionalis]|uniref:unconventional myosin-XV n=1 Tax=Toxorhynchites rutilus septentrionalis TaxID=329112 RepID=UPI002479109E|nr:unconventional myosin-XV [Toxorhynchites rutilus septentrionalis]XP_055630322.1 unconventional myosin-XV [Toxorhynchites rutilus septentrionalis]XP_055630323.1 unconventional myosin-XV [Toxorhynchites rutilus septentrionalis]XP_055630324.1 unconventional myosin-XV [Toxorhynchites rutilus septentrionalis]
MDWTTGDLVWFDSGLGHPLPGEIYEVHRAAQVIIVQALINGKHQTFTLGPGEGNLRSRQDLGKTGVEDMTQLDDLHEATLLWNLKLRYDNGLVYTYAGSILVAMNPYKMFPGAYGIEMAKIYSGKPLGVLPPHLFAIGSAAHASLPSPQVVVISGESGSGKTESTKLVMQYLAAVVPGGGSASAVITEQILEAAPLLEAFGNARTTRNDNSSRFGKYLEVFFKSGAIIGAKITQYLLEKSRIVTQAPGERNYHVFYELLGGLSETDRTKYGLLDADKYFYLNQGGSDCSTGRVDWASLQGAMQVLGVSESEQEGIVNVLASVLHLGNVYFHRRQLRHGQEGVEIGSDAEIKWAAHLLKIPSEGILRSLTSRITETRSERLYTPLSIDQALDARDALAKALYSGLFNWLVLRINSIVHKAGSHDAHRISILDIFGFENLAENSFEQLCINYANESLQLYFNKHVFKLEQAEYAKERLDWTPLEWDDNLPVIHLLAKKPVGIFHLLDDESNFPRANDMSFLEKCHYNHALSELYSRPRIGAQEFGITHYAGQVWYCVEGFLEKNRDALRMDVIELLSSSTETLVGEMTKQLRAQRDFGKTLPRGINGRFVTMKPRTPTVAARFSDSLQQLLQSMAKCNPWFVRCVKPNNEKQALRMDMPCVLQQLRYLGMLDTITIRQRGYPVRLRFQHFVERYRYMLKTPLPRGTPYRELCRFVLDSLSGTSTEGPDFQLGATRVFLREYLHRMLEAGRSERLRMAAIIIQKNVRGMLARKRIQRQKRGAVTIQKTWRGYRDRKKYTLLKNGVMKAQALYRGHAQRIRYAKLKIEMQRRRDAERIQKERAAQNFAKEQERNSVLLDIPAELAFIFSKSENWSGLQYDRYLVKVVGTVPGPPTASDLPSDLDQFAFGKFSSVYCNGMKISSRRDVITVPFLSRAAARDQDFKDAIAIFKLILRWSSDSLNDQNKHKLMADYIVHKGLSSRGLRDEILVQICNQVYKAEESYAEKLWLLMSHCLSAFQPGSAFNKYLIKFIVDNAPQNTKEQLLKKILRNDTTTQANSCRLFPPSWLEWKASARLADTALGLVLPDGVMQTVAVDSWTTCEEAAALAISSLGIPNLGWTVVIDDSGLIIDSCGMDYVLDLVSEKEINPSFPAVRNDLLKCGSRNQHITMTEQDISRKRPQVPPPEPPSLKRMSEFQLPPAIPNTLITDSNLDGIEIRPSYTHQIESITRKSSHDAMSRSKILKDHYFDSEKSRSRSLDDLLGTDSNEIIAISGPETLNSVITENRQNDHYQSSDGIAPLRESQPRYVKSQYAGKRLAGSHSSKYIEKSEMTIRSSAMSDTSEAPSLASHVRRVRVPSQASDVDQFLDDLFSPVLDGSLDELSDVRSVAASIRGNAADAATNVGPVRMIQENIEDLLRSVEICQTVSGLRDKNQMLKIIKGGGTTHQSKNNVSSGFSPNGSNYNASPISPVSSATSSSLLMMRSVSPEVVVPVFNVSPGVDTATYQHQVQRAFLQSAMAQNIQIQQQLIAQNQALQTLLTQQDPSSSPNVQNLSPKQTVSHSPPTPQLSARKSIINTRSDSTTTSLSELLRNRKDSSSSNLIPPPPPPPLPPPLEMKDPLEVRPFLDPYGRAKTVRIGKWRWPPPQGSTNAESEENFTHFKMRQINRKTTPQPQNHSNVQSPVGSPSGIEWDEFEIEQQVNSNRGNVHESIDQHQKSNQTNRVSKRSFDIGADRPSPSSVGKLKLSNEMRQRLEQVTAGHSIRSTSTRSDRAEKVPAKLEETRRLILEQQLSGIIAVQNSHNTQPELPSVKNQVQKMESNKRSTQTSWPTILPPAPAGPAPPPPIRPPNTTPPAPPLPIHMNSSPSYSPQSQTNLQEIPSFIQRQERDTFGAKELFNDSWSRAEAAKLEQVYETNLKKEAAIQRERSRSRSRSRDRDNFSESVWDRSEVEGPPSTNDDRENKEREKRERNYEMSQIQREKESNKVYQPAHPKEKPKPMKNSRQTVATFKTHMAQKSVQEKERKSSTTTVASHNNEHLGEVSVMVNDPPTPILPTPVSSLKTPASVCLTYNKTSWKLRVRKEVFRPNETVNTPAALDLLFLQITSDVFGITPCLRISPQERRAAINLLNGHGVMSDNIFGQNRSIVKRHLLDMARSWPLYFSRLFILNASPSIASGTLLAVSHSGVFLARKEQDVISVHKSTPFNDLQSVTTLPRPLAFQLTIRNGNRVILHAAKATIIQNMIQSFLVEYRQTQSKGPTISSGVRAAAAILNVPLERLEIPNNSPNSPNQLSPVEKSQRSSQIDFETLQLDNNIHLQQHQQQDNPSSSPNKHNNYGHYQHHKKNISPNGSNYAHETDIIQPEESSPTQTSLTKHSLLQFATQHFRNDGEEFKNNRNEGRSSSARSSHADLVKWQGTSLHMPLLRLPPDLAPLALECFDCILRYCGDLIADADQTEVKCVYTVLMHCHKHLALRDEVYCQLIKQTTANRSQCPDSAQRAWRLLSILAAYFGCSEALRPYLIEHLTSAASDRRRSCHGTAAVCLTNLRKTARCGGRKNVPSVEEVTAVSAGRSARRQIYRLPGGAERIVNTRCSTVVGDVITELCALLGIDIVAEQQEFSLYCIVQGDAFTMPLAADEYILDVTTELLKSGQPFYLIFCRSVWHFPLKRDPAPTPLYIEVLFNQVAPDYLEGLLLELPNGGAPTPDYVRDMARIAAILHRAADLNHLPAMKEIKFLLPKPALSLRELRPAQWVALVQSAWPSIANLSPIQVKAQFLNVLSSWPLFGSSFFAVKRVWSEEAIADDVSPMWRELILALNRQGVLFLDPNTHETMQHWAFNEVISTRKVRSEDGALFLDMKVGNLLQQRVIRVQTEQAHEISRLVRQYITMAQVQLKDRRE